MRSLTEFIDEDGRPQDRGDLPAVRDRGRGTLHAEAAKIDALGNNFGHNGPIHRLCELIEIPLSY
jgi:hypothetical protein